MINSYQIVPEAGKISLLVAPSLTRPLLLEATAQLALKDSVTILDGGNSFDGYGLARLLRSKTADLQAALHNVLDKLNLERLDKALGLFLGLVEGVLAVAVLLFVMNWLESILSIRFSFLTGRSFFAALLRPLLAAVIPAVAPAAK